MIVLYVSIGFFLVGVAGMMLTKYYLKMTELQLREWALNKQLEDLVELDSLLTEDREVFEQEIRRKLLAENRFN